MKLSFNAPGEEGGAPRDRTAPAPALPDPRRVRSQDLMAGATELVIDHAGQAYRLRITRNGKLILTK